MRPASQRPRWLILASVGALSVGALFWALGHRSSAPAAAPSPARAVASAPPARQQGPLPSRAAVPGAASAESGPEARRGLRERRLARAELTLQTYLDASRYPPEARPIEERPDLARPHQVPARTLPLARADRAPTTARLTLRQDRYFAAAKERVTMVIGCSGEAGPARCEGVSAKAVLPPDMPGNIGPVVVPFNEDGQGAVTASFQPGSQGFSAYHGPIRVEVELRVGQESGSASFDLQYTPTPPATFTGAVREAMVDGSLELYVGLKVERAGRYLLRGRVDDADGKAFAYLSDNEVLTLGDREAKLRLFGKLIRDARARAPFRLHDLEGFLLEENTSPDRANMADLEGTVYTTRRYAEGDFTDAEWSSEEKTRRLRDLNRDVEKATEVVGDPPSKG